MKAFPVVLVLLGAACGGADDDLDLVPTGDLLEWIPDQGDPIQTDGEVEATEIIDGPSCTGGISLEHSAGVGDLVLPTVDDAIVGDRLFYTTMFGKEDGRGAAGTLTVVTNELGSVELRLDGEWCTSEGCEPAAGVLSFTGSWAIAPSVDDSPAASGNVFMPSNEPACRYEFW